MEDMVSHATFLKELIFPDNPKLRGVDNDSIRVFSTG